jgi:micrococcal nuclease
MNYYKAKLKKIIDGDTVDLYVNLGIGFFCNARIRLLGIDAPEIYKVKKESEEFKQGQIAKLEVKKWFLHNGIVYQLGVVGRDLYGRWLGEIWRDDCSKSLNDYLREKFYKSSYWTWEHQRPLKEEW